MLSWLKVGVKSLHVYNQLLVGGWPNFLCQKPIACDKSTVVMVVCFEGVKIGK
jgi:hypothetical protein